MDKNEIIRHLLKEIAGITGKTEPELSEEKSLSANGIDSMGFVELLLIIKREYNVNLVEAGLRAADVKSVAALAQKIAGKEA